MPTNSMSYVQYGRSYPSPHYSTISSKNGYPSVWSQIGYGDESPSPIEAYSLHPSGCVSSQDSYSGLLSSQENGSRSWNAITLKNPMNNNSLFVDRDAVNYSTCQSGYTTTSTSRQAAVTTEPVSPFGMTSLHSSLPFFERQQERQLPAPNTNFQQMTTSATDTNPMRSLVSSQCTGGSSLSTSANYTKEAMGWTADNVSPGSRQSSINGLPAGDTMAPPPTKNSASASVMESSVLGYIPLTSSSPEHSPTTVPSLTYSGTSRSTPTPNLVCDKYPSTSTLMTTNTSSTRNALLRNDSSSDLYSFSTGGSLKRNSLNEGNTSEGMLVSGHKYAPLLQPQPQHTTSIEALRHESFDERSRPRHREAIASLSNRDY